MKANKIICGDNIQVMKTLPDESIQCCITSPPYWGLRDYGTATWDGGDADCEHLSDRSKYETGFKGSKQASNKGTGNRDIIKHDTCPKCGAKRIDNQLGLEKTPEEYVENLVKVFREVKRVLRKDGTLWLNLGDSYAGNNSRASNGGRAGYGTEREGVFNNLSGNLKPKDLVGIPWRVAFALQSDGWYLRQDIIWHKPNPMPESVTDRCTKSHEYMFLLSKSQKYYYDADVIREPLAESTLNDIRIGCKTGRPNKKAHKLVMDGTHGSGGIGDPSKTRAELINLKGRNKRSVWTVTTRPFKKAHFATFPPKLIEPCILAGCPKGGIIIDPFMGAGTVALVARENNRDFVGCELNPEYIKIANQRINNAQLSLF